MSSLDEKNEYLDTYEDATFLENPKSDGNAFFQALIDGNHESVVSLLSSGKYDVNSKTSEGLTPLMLATLRCEPETLRFLVSKGADTETQFEQYGHVTAIFLAQANPQNAKTLIELGANAAHKRSCGMTLAHFAASALSSEMLSIAAENGVNIGDVNNPLNSSPAFIGIWLYARNKPAHITAEHWDAFYSLLLEHTPLNMPLIDTEVFGAAEAQFEAVPVDTVLQYRAMVGFCYSFLGNVMKAHIEHPDLITNDHVQLAIDKGYTLLPTEQKKLLAGAIMHDNNMALEQLILTGVDPLQNDVLKDYDVVTLAAACGAGRCLQRLVYESQKRQETEAIAAKAAAVKAAEAGKQESINTTKTTNTTDATATDAAVSTPADPNFDTTLLPPGDPALPPLHRLLLLSPHSPSQQCLMRAAPLVVLSQLLSVGLPAEEVYKGMPLLCIACMSGQWSHAKMLVAYGADGAAAIPMPMTVLRADDTYHNIPQRSAIGVCLALGDSASDMLRYLLDKSITRGTVEADITPETILGGVTFSEWEKYCQENNFPKMVEVLHQLKDGKLGKKSEDEKIRFQKFQEAVSAATNAAMPNTRSFSTTRVSTRSEISSPFQFHSPSFSPLPSSSMGILGTGYGAAVRVRSMGMGSAIGTSVRKMLRYLK